MSDKRRQQGSRTRTRAQAGQSGFTLVSLMFWAIVVGLAAVLVIKLAPVVIEYRTISSMVTRAAREGGDTVPGIRAAYDRMAQIEYGINSVQSGKDLDISKEDDKVVVRFAYDKEVPLVEPVYLLIKFKGQSE